MPLPVADPKKPPIVFLSPDVFGSPASQQCLLALHIEFYPHYVITNQGMLARDDVVEALVNSGLDFVADSLHNIWNLPQGCNLGERIEEWARQQPPPREPFSYLLIEGTGSRNVLAETHLADYTVLCDTDIGFDEEGMVEARRILRSQIPSKSAH